jgi:hypothetical protein
MVSTDEKKNHELESMVRGTWSHVENSIVTRNASTPSRVRMATASAVSVNIIARSSNGRFMFGTSRSPKSAV